MKQQMTFGTSGGPVSARSFEIDRDAEAHCE
jgi:hypothetical protein